MQTRFSKILIVLLFPSLAAAQSVNQQLLRADSLFRAKQYTQAFVLYDSVVASKRYTPAMFLKMAYIQEGLGHVGSCLYYLNLYHLASGDDQALGKMEELAQKNQLQGYEASKQHQARQYWQRYLPSVALFCLALAGLSLAWAFVQRKRNAVSLPFVVTGFCMIILAAAANNALGTRAPAIVNGPQTYVLDAPSAGGTVLEILAEGHRVEVSGTKDVWARVKWRDKSAYIKKNQLREVKL